jgi:aminoglycoside phosphotransferase family enzyme/predicted kinase
MAEAAQRIAALQSPDAYPHPAPQIELIETHISWVLLAGAFAYKIKKPVRLPFADFSTLDRRRFYCEEELRLNRRLAARLYLEVVAITGPPTAPRIALSSKLPDDFGEPVEFAVKMRRFPQDALLSRLAKTGLLTREHINQFARAAADFHARIAIAQPGDSWGSCNCVAQPIEENFAELLSTAKPGDGLYERLMALQAWNADQLTRLRDTMEARRQGGFVRECHGDMHLRNAVLLPREAPSCDGADEVVIFDGIDFNENLRWIDVQNEIAFPVMDLDRRGHAELAWRFLNAYLEATGDYEGLAVLPLYLNYRALVRAKVDWIRGQQNHIPREERRQLEDDFARYLALAERYAQTRRPRLFLTHGVSGSGKSYFSRRLSELAGAVQIRSDVERKRLYQNDLYQNEGAALADEPSRTKHHLYSRKANEQTYARLQHLADAALAAGFSVIVDATFLSHARREQFRRLASRRGAPHVILDFHASPDLLRRRLAARQAEGLDASDADVGVLMQQLQNRQPLLDAELPHALRIDAEPPEVLEASLVAAAQWSES